MRPLFQVDLDLFQVDHYLWEVSGSKVGRHEEGHCFLSSHHPVSRTLGQGHRDPPPTSLPCARRHEPGMLRPLRVPPRPVLLIAQGGLGAVLSNCFFPPKPSLPKPEYSLKRNQIIGNYLRSETEDFNRFIYLLFLKKSSRWL